MTVDGTILNGSALAALSASTARRFPLIINLTEVTSTNDEAWRLREREGVETVVVLAHRQTGGRGRMGRTWSSPEGNLYLSVLRRIREPLERSGIMSLLAGIAMCRAVVETADIRPALKWPNDLLMGTRKLAGILLEARDGWQVVGAGINANGPIAGLPGELQETATSLRAETGKLHELGHLAAHFLAELGRLEAAFEADPALPVDDYMAFYPFVGTRVAAQLPGGSVEGDIVRVANDGTLVLSGQGGEEVRVTSGEVIHVRSK